jgi:hypothetical protein
MSPQQTKQRVEKGKQEHMNVVFHITVILKNVALVLFVITPSKKFDLFLRGMA